MLKIVSVEEMQQHVHEYAHEAHEGAPGFLVMCGQTPLAVMLGTVDFYDLLAALIAGREGGAVRDGKAGETVN